MTKTKTTLKSLIKAKKLDYVNFNITAKNFPAPKEIGTDFKLFHFDKSIASEDVIKAMEAEGYHPADLYELLSFDWNGTDWVAALGSVCEVDGYRVVPHLDGGGSGRGLGLGWWVDGWDSLCRFLAVRLSSDAKTSALGHSGILSLEAAIKMVKDEGFTIVKII